MGQATRRTGPIGAQQLERRQRIEAAAYEVLAEVGYRSASILAIARRARASNETLYQWYGNKQGLFLALVQANARSIHDQLDAPSASSALVALQALGPALLEMVTSDRAICLNRAAAAEVSDTGALGRSIADGGRDAVIPRLIDLLQRLRADRVIDWGPGGDVAAAAETYVALLIGDWQIRRVIGVMPRPTRARIAARAGQALRQFLQLHPPAQPSAARVAPIQRTS